MAENPERQKAKEARRAGKVARRKQRRKAQAVLSSAQIAGQLRTLASQVETGRFTLGDTEVDVPGTAEFEISYKVRKMGGHQIKVEIEWGNTIDAPLLPTE